MSKAAMNLQDSFLNQVRRENSEVRVLLVNGTLLRGTVKGFDNFTLILNNRNGQHLIYKHAVAQIVTHRPYNKNEEFPSVESDSDDEASESIAEKSEKPEASEAAAPSSPRHDNRAKRDSSAKHDSSAKQDSNPKHDTNAKHDVSAQHETDTEQASAKQKPRKEGFNKLDLSHLKLAKGEKP